MRSALREWLPVVAVTAAAIVGCVLALEIAKVLDVPPLVLGLSEFSEIVNAQTLAKKLLSMASRSSVTCHGPPPRSTYSHILDLQREAAGELDDVGFDVHLCGVDLEHASRPGPS